jgi:hypothetical protein
MIHSFLRPRFLIAVLFLVVLCVYWPGLSGDFEFDDMPNILDNKKLLLDSLDWSSLRRSMLSGEAGPLGRPISMLSFALNYYYSGFDPFYFKLINVVLHALNGMVLFLLAQKIGQYLLPEKEKQLTVLLASLCLALLWVVSPINLTSVLYVVQRMTSLAGFFSLLALLGYVSFRIEAIRLPYLTNRAIIWLVIAVLACGASVLSKENGVLTPAYALVLELAVFRFVRNQGGITHWHWPLVCIFTAMVMAAIAIHIWLLIVNPGKLASGYALRDFTLEQRLFTQPRVLVFYLKQILFPDISQMGLYHDDFSPSTGWLQPLGTVFAISGLLIALVGIGWALCSAPLMALPVLWFLVGHSLESSILPLELVHEHRNYLPSIGIFLLPVMAVCYALLRKKLPIPVVAGVVVMIILQAAQTCIRADQWGNLVDHAAIEVKNHPASGRANYQLGRIYFKLYSADRRPAYYQAAKHYFEVVANQRAGENGGHIGLIQLAYLAGQSVEPMWISTLAARLKNYPPYPSNVPFLSAFLDCQMRHYCNLPAKDVIYLFESASKNSRASKDMLARIHSMLGVYLVNKLHNGTLAEPHLLAAYQYNQIPEYAVNVSALYLMVNRIDSANIFLDIASRLDRFGYFRLEISRQRALLHQKMVKEPMN